MLSHSLELLADNSGADLSHLKLILIYHLKLTVANLRCPIPIESFFIWLAFVSPVLSLISASGHLRNKAHFVGPDGFQLIFHSANHIFFVFLLVNFGQGLAPLMVIVSSWLLHWISYIVQIFFDFWYLLSLRPSRKLKRSFIRIQRLWSPQVEEVIGLIHLYLLFLIKVYNIVLRYFGRLIILRVSFLNLDVENIAAIQLIQVDPVVHALS